MRLLTMIACLAALAVGQQANSPTASLEVTGDGTTFTIGISGLPAQAWALYVADGPPAYGAMWVCSASVDLAYWNGVVEVAAGLTGPADVVGQGHATIAATLPPGLSLTMQATVTDPNAPCGLALTQAVYVGT